MALTFSEHMKDITDVIYSRNGLHKIRKDSRVILGK